MRYVGLMFVVWGLLFPFSQSALAAMTEGKDAEKIISRGKILSQKDWDSHAVYRVIYEDRLYECRTKLPYLERYADEAADEDCEGLQCSSLFKRLTDPDKGEDARKNRALDFITGLDKEEDNSPENDPRIIIRCYDID